ncbi:hypothetical protein OQA88_12954 [Cercophora sp. LCS_1]
MGVSTLLQLLGDPIQTYELFAQDLPSHSLGFIDPKATTLDLTIGGVDLTIHQSPGVLSSNRAGGTTGAVWKITPLFAEWISSPDHNPLFAHGLLDSSSFVIELGTGISALVGLLLGRRVGHCVLTDQLYVAKLVEQNVAENTTESWTGSSSGRSSSTVAKAKRVKGKHAGAEPKRRAGNVHFTPLDWETDTPTPELTLSDSVKSFDCVVACDCIYNEALIDPFVSTCADVCRLREQARAEAEASPGSPEPCVCIVAQQLRDPDIFEAWLTRFTESFYAWRVPDSMLIEGLRSKSGFVVHLGVLKGVGFDSEPSQ